MQSSIDFDSQGKRFTLTNMFSLIIIPPGDKKCVGVCSCFLSYLIKCYIACLLWLHFIKEWRSLTRKIISHFQHNVFPDFCISFLQSFTFTKLTLFNFTAYCNLLSDNLFSIFWVIWLSVCGHTSSLLCWQAV